MPRQRREDGMRVHSPALRLAPLVVATMASQALLVVLSPTIVAIGRDLGASVAAVGQARSLTALVAIAASLAITTRMEALGVRRLAAAGAAAGVAACTVVATASSLAVFLAAHVLVGVALACLLSAGFAGVAAFPAERRPWAVGWVAGANALAWVVVNPAAGFLTSRISWRAAEAVPGVLALASLAVTPALAMVPAGRSVPRLGALLADTSARRWIGAELIAYSAWTGLLTFVGAFFVQDLGVGEASVGWMLAAGAAAYFAAATRSGRLVARVRRRRLVAGAAAAMALQLPVLLELPSASAAVAVFCLVGVTAGVRTPASSGLGLDQLPGHPGAMMGARSAATQLGYLLGAVVGGPVIAGGGYGALGLVLAGGLLVSGALALRVHDPRLPAQAAGASSAV